MYSLALLLAGLLPGTAGAKDQVLSTQVAEVEVQLLIPADVKVLRGLIVHAANYRLKEDDRWAELCRELHFGHVAMNIPNVQKATNRGAKLHKALHEGLKEFAEKSGHPELVHLPLAGTGHSAGGLVTGVLLRTPERTLTNCVDCGWVMDPEKLTPEAARVPALFTMGAIPDAFQMLPSIEKHFEPARKQDLPWGLGVQWGCAHDFGNTAALMVPWIRTVSALRLPADAAKDGPVRLKDLKPEDGWLGDRKTIEGSFATVAPWADFKGDRSVAAWFPNRSVAYAWRAWQSKDAPVVLEAATADGKSKLPPWKPKASRDLTVNPDQPLVLGATIKAGTAVKRVQYYDGDVLLGEASAAPWQVTWPKPARGCHALWAQWETTDGQPGAANPALIIVRQHPKE